MLSRDSGEGLSSRRHGSMPSVTSTLKCATSPRKDTGFFLVVVRRGGWTATAPRRLRAQRPPASGLACAVRLTTCRGQRDTRTWNYFFKCATLAETSELPPARRPCRVSDARQLPGLISRARIRSFHRVLPFRFSPVRQSTDGVSGKLRGGSEIERATTTTGQRIDS